MVLAAGATLSSRGFQIMFGEPITDLPQDTKVNLAISARLHLK